MNHDRLFVLQVVVAIEEQWFADSDWNTPVRTSRSYYLEQHLFAAEDEEAAYEMALNWVNTAAYSDSNHDGAGDLTRIFALGIHELEEVGRVHKVAQESNDLYGIDLPGIDPADVDADGVPLIGAKDDLEVFRRRRILRGTGAP